MDAINTWNILIVDDSKKIHKITENPFFKEKILDKSINFISVYNKEDAIEELSKNHKKISVVLFDLDMSAHGGMDLIYFVRNDLKNKKIQIILRSDNELDFSNKDIINNHNIHDYIHKTENTNGKLYFTIKSAISTYNDIEALAFSNNELKASIRGALLIQKALFPKKEILYNTFPESFILHLPQQEVSGDFYYFTKTSEKFIIITADCTGHGVAASLTSVLGLSFLKKIIEDDKILDPAKILIRLDQEILKIFKHNKAESNVNDGMDMSICTIDLRTKEMMYSGANNPIIHYSADSRNVLNVLKVGIGGDTKISEKNFVNKSIQLQSGDSIYMLSDGYIEQVGDKKLQKSALNNLIDRINKKKMSKQAELLLKFHNKQRGKNEQTDDILIIGVKIP